MRGEAQRVAGPAQTPLQNSRVTGPEFVKFLSDEEGSSSVVTCTFTLQSFHPLWYASAENEGGGCQVSPIRTKNRLA